jgi:hypothetical protein
MTGTKPDTDDAFRDPGSARVDATGRFPVILSPPDAPPSPPRWSAGVLDED